MFEFVFLRWILYSETLFTCVLLYVARPCLRNTKQIEKEHQRKFLYSNWWERQGGDGFTGIIQSKPLSLVRDCTGSLLFKLHLNIEPRSSILRISTSPSGWNPCTSLQLQRKLVWVFVHIWFDVSSSPPHPTLSRLFWAPYSVNKRSLFNSVSVGFVWRTCHLHQHNYRCVLTRRNMFLTDLWGLSLYWSTKTSVSALPVVFRCFPQCVKGLHDAFPWIMGCTQESLGSWIIKHWCKS